MFSSASSSIQKNSTSKNQNFFSSKEVDFYGEPKDANPFFQTKLAKNKPNNKQEGANFFGNQLTESSNNKKDSNSEFKNNRGKKSVPVRIQQKCESCENEKMINQSSENEETLESSSTIDKVVSNSGSPLEKPVQNEMNEKMGIDFSNVRIHTDNDSAKSAKSLNASAYTLGNHIVFDEGQYNPNSVDGKKLLTHELVHTTQKDNTTTVRRAMNPKCKETKRIGSISGGLPTSQGNLAQLAIQSDYQKMNPNAVFEFSIVNGSYSSKKYPGYADIVDLKTGEVFEIKPANDLRSAENEVNHYIAKLKTNCDEDIDWKRGTNYPVKKRKLVIDPSNNVIYAWKAVDGVILYENALTEDTVLCGFINDGGNINGFLDRSQAMTLAEVNKIIDSEVDAILGGVATSASGFASAFFQFPILNNFNDIIKDKIKNQLNELAYTITDNVRKNIRNTIVQIINELCLTGIAITLAEITAKIIERIKEIIFGELLELITQLGENLKPAGDVVLVVVLFLICLALVPYIGSIGQLSSLISLAPFLAMVTRLRTDFMTVINDLITSMRSFAYGF